MGKTRSWMNYVKKLFTPNSKPKSKSQEKSGNRGRVANKKLKFRRRSCYLAIEETPRSTLNEAAEEQRKRAVAVAVATAAAAEAAMASVNAAVEVVRLANSPYDAERKISEMAAAIKIQAAYRGHLAKKALHALKGIVKLQAVVRGQLTRKSVSFLVRRTRVAVPLLDYPNHGQTRRSSILNEGIEFGEHKLHCNTRMVSKGSGIAERECMRRYSFSHQEKKNDQNSLLSRLNTIAVDTTRPTKLKVDTTRKHGKVEDSKSPSSQPRRSFCHVKQNSTGDNVSSLPNSPAYMAATECTKAKLRSLSTPRQRLRLYDTYSGPDSPYKLSLSSGGSFNGEMIARTHKRK